MTSVARAMPPSTRVLMASNTWGWFVCAKARAKRAMTKIISGIREDVRDGVRRFFFFIFRLLYACPLVRYDLNFGVGGVEEDVEEEEEGEISTWSGTTSRNSLSSCSTCGRGERVS